MQVAIAHGNLQRLLDNLIGNALQYGAPPVEIGLAVRRAGFVSLTVRDHGDGIPSAQRARALEAFAQIDPARATRGSCGLGLAIVRRIVKACGGEVMLDEAPGGGLLVRIAPPDDGCMSGVFRRKIGGALLFGEAGMSHKHLHLLQTIYHDPISANIHWREIESLLTHLGATVEAAHGGRVARGTQPGRGFPASPAQQLDLRQAGNQADPRVPGACAA